MALPGYIKRDIWLCSPFKNIKSGTKYSQESRNMFGAVVKIKKTSVSHAERKKEARKTGHE
jgi:hypothetical protein